MHIQRIKSNQGKKTYEQDLLVGFFALFGYDSLDMHDVYLYKHINQAWSIK